MLQWFRERNASPRNSEHEQEEAPAVLSPRSAVSEKSLPSQQDRMLLLRAVLFAADTLQQKKYGHEDRLKVILQQELVYNSCVALHLAKEQEEQDEQELCMTMANAACLDPTLVVQEPYACITLLLSNVVLLYGSKGGYDSRVRHTLKTACVHVLSTSMEANLDEEEAKEMEEFDESVGAIYRAGQVGNKSEGGDKNTTVASSTSNDEEKKEDTTEPTTASDETKDDGGDDESTVDKTTCKESVVEMSQSTDSAALTEVTLSQEDENNSSLTTKRQSHIQYIVTRKFELVERAIATRIFRVLMEENEAMKVTDGERTTFSKDESKIVRKRVVRGLQITSVGVVAGTLFAVTGGLAGPAIAAGIAGLGVVSSATAATAIAMLTTVKAAAALFGVGGGGLAAYKMKKRTQGLTEFHIRRENIEQNVYEGASDESVRRGIQASLPQLHSTICISGWLKLGKSDYQRPWGIQPTDPPIQDKMELLKRFFIVHDPDLVGSCEDVIKKRKKRERKEFSWQAVWAELEKQYGRNPDHLLPLDTRTTNKVTLSNDEQRAINDLLRKVVLINRDPTFAEEDDDTDIESNDSSFSSDNSTIGDDKDGWKWLWFGGDQGKAAATDGDGSDVKADDSFDSDKSKEEAVQESSSGEQSGSDEPQNTSGTDLVVSRKTKEPDDTLVVWDWEAVYGGDMHTVTWESKVLLDLCHVVSTMATEVTSQATKYALQYSMIGAIVAAVAIPSALLTASQLIDDPYQIVILRADEAGIELAKCLLQSEERRPVTLVGYSFGSRVIYSCLMELARHQKLWEKKQGLTEKKEVGRSESFLFRNEEDESESIEYTREPASIVEDVVFMGLPRRLDRKAFKTCRQVVGGRMVNCYTRNDWFLSLMFIARAGTQTCGTSPIEDVEGVENYNVTDLVPAHADYPDAVPAILQRVNFGKPNALSS